MLNKKKLLVSLLSAATLLTACDTATIEDEPSGNQDAQQEEQSSQGTEKDNKKPQGSTDFASGVTAAVEAADEAVVSVMNMQQINGDLSSILDFYGLPTPDMSGEPTLEQAGTGSGVIYKSEGGDAYVVTNNHVVDGSDALEVLFMDGTTVEAELVGSDVWTDLAVLKIPNDAVTTVAEFGDSDQLVVGEPAIAIGSPLGTEFASSVTAGIISGIGRSVPVDTDGDQQVDWETSAIQTDAAINPGNSGGALVNAAGQVIGINSMKISSSTVEGMGFAIPSNDVKDIVKQLEENGEVIRPYLGIGLMDLSFISADEQALLKLPEDLEQGVVVSSVVPGSPADDAGLQDYDVIVGFNGEPVTGSVELRQNIYSSEVGSEVELEFYRDGEKQTTTVTMRPADSI